MAFSHNGKQFEPCPAWKVKGHPESTLLRHQQAVEHLSWRLLVRLTVLNNSNIRLPQNTSPAHWSSTGLTLPPWQRLRCLNCLLAYETQHPFGKPFSVKLLRICLLVLLAVLLPVRGAMAATLPCPPSGAGTQSEMHPMDHASAVHGHAEAPGAHTQHQHNDGTQHDHGAPCQDKCNLCSAFCSLTPLLSAAAGIAEPQRVVDATFPSLSAPAPSFFSDGQERPPRSS
jgi:hypothetical protein